MSPIRLALLLVSLAACSVPLPTKDVDGEDPESDSAPTGVGTLELRFGIDEDYAAVMAEPPIGIFYGGFFTEDDVTDVGVTDGAEAITTFELSLNLPLDGTLTDVLYTSDPLPVGKLYVLGFLDSDANATDGEPDQGDPVTRPETSHRVAVADGAVVEGNVVLDLLMP